MLARAQYLGLAPSIKSITIPCHSRQQEMETMSCYLPLHGQERLVGLPRVLLGRDVGQIGHISYPSDSLPVPVAESRYPMGL